MGRGRSASAVRPGRRSAGPPPGLGQGAGAWGEERGGQREGAGCLGVEGESGAMATVGASAAMRAEGAAAGSDSVRCLPPRREDACVCE